MEVLVASPAPIGLSDPAVDDGELRPPRAQLTFVEGPFTGDVYPLGGLPFTLGRGADRDLCIAGDETVSRLHACVVWMGGAHVACNCSRGKLTYVNGEQLLTPRSLKTGDRLAFGYRHVLLYELTEETAWGLVVVDAGFELEAVEGELAGQTFPYLRDCVSIGRGNGCDLRLSDKSVSRQHAFLVADNAGRRKLVNRSKGGSYVNGELCSGERPLEAGNRLYFGRQDVFVFSPVGSGSDDFDAGSPELFGFRLRGETARRPPVRFREPCMVIGSSESCDLRLEGPGVAPEQAVVVLRGAGAIVHPKRPGTRIAGHEMDRPAALKLGGRILLGSQCELELFAGPDEPSTSDQPVSGQTYELLAVAGPVAGERYALDGACFTIGCTEDCTLQMGYPRVPAQAVMILDSGGEKILYPQGGQITLNGIPLTWHRPIAPGDTFEIAEGFAFRLELGPETPPVREELKPPAEEAQPEEAPAPPVAEGAGPARYYLEIVRGQPVQGIDKLCVEETKLRIGSMPDCELQFEYSDLADLHAEIVIKEDGAYLYNKSPDGTLVGRQPVTERRLEDGDLITLSEDVVLQYWSKEPVQGQGSGADSGERVYCMLVFQEGEKSGAVLDFRRPVVTMGRATTCDVTFASEYVSHEHAEIVIHGGNCCLVHKGRNETRVNGRQVEGETELLDNDQIELPGGNRLTFVELRELRKQKPGGRAGPLSLPPPDGPPEIFGAEASMAWALRQVRGPFPCAPGEIVQRFDAPLVVIGKLKDHCDLVIKDPRLAKREIRIRTDGKQLFATQLGHAAVLLDRQPLKGEMPVKHRSHLSLLGEIELEVDLEVGRASQSAQPDLVAPTPKKAAGGINLEAVASILVTVGLIVGMTMTDSGPGGPQSYLRGAIEASYATMDPRELAWLSVMAFGDEFLEPAAAPERSKAVAPPGQASRLGFDEAARKKLYNRKSKASAQTFQLPGESELAARLTDLAAGAAVHPVNYREAFKLLLHCIAVARPAEKEHYARKLELQAEPYVGRLAHLCFEGNSRAKDGDRENAMSCFEQVRLLTGEERNPAYKLACWEMLELKSQESRKTR